MSARRRADRAESIPGGRAWRGENLGLNRSCRPGGSSLFCCAKGCFQGCRRRPPSQPRSGVIVQPGARAPGARCQRNSRCSFGLQPQRGDFERLAARGWHNAVSPPLGLREVAHTQIPGAHAPGFTIPPHSGGSETNTSVNGTGMIGLAVQAQLFTGPAAPQPSPQGGGRGRTQWPNNIRLIQRYGD
jgi:hypothetical protein